MIKYSLEIRDIFFGNKLIILSSKSFLRSKSRCVISIKYHLLCEIIFTAAKDFVINLPVIIFGHLSCQTVKSLITACSGHLPDLIRCFSFSYFAVNIYRIILILRIFFINVVIINYVHSTFHRKGNFLIYDYTAENIVRSIFCKVPVQCISQ